MKRTKPVMLNVRVTRNLSNRLKRASAIQGVSQSSIIISAIDRDLMRWEKKYAEQVKLQKEAGLFEEDSD